MENTEFMENNEFMEAMQKAAEAIRSLLDAVAEAFSAIAKRISCALSSALDKVIKCVATPREYHLAIHSKKTRVRRKWRAILLKRLVVALS